MKRFVLVAFTLACILPNLFADDPIVGYWKSFDEKTKEVNAYWKIWVQDGKLCGTIVKVPKKADSIVFDKFVEKNKKEYDKSPSAPITAQTPILGTVWMFDLKKKKEGFWIDGRIIHSGKGEVYGVECELKKDASKDFLEFRGYLLGLSLFKKVEKWERVTMSELATAGVKL